MIAKLLTKHTNKSASSQQPCDDGKSLLALGLFPGAGVFEGDHAFREGFVFEEGEFALREAAGEKWDAFADQDWNDSDIKFVDEVIFEEVAGELAAAHQPDVSSGALAERFNESLRGFVDEGDAAAFSWGLRVRENVHSHLRLGERAAAHLESHLIGLPAHDRFVNRGEERAHGIVLWHEDKIDCAIGTGDVAVEADAEAKDDLAHGRILNEGL